MADFGERLRALRLERKVSMGELARSLNVSVPYISDVERGNRAPLTPDRILATAKVLSISPDELLRLAAEAKGTIELPLTSSSAKMAPEVGAALMRGWQDLTDEDLESIARIIGKKGARLGWAPRTVCEGTGSRG